MSSATSPLDFASIAKRLQKEPDGYKRVEQIVTRLLGRKLAENNRSLEVNEGSGFDAVAPAGIDDLPGPTIVDITYNLKRVRSPRFLPDLQKAVGQRVAKGVLLVSAGGLDPDRVQWIESRAITTIPDVQLRIWGPQELTKLLELYPDAVGGLVPELGSRAMAAVVQQADTDWRERRRRHITELRRTYFSDKLTLFLGAGASMDCGIPGWKNLISELALQMVDEQTPKNETTASRQMNRGERMTIANAMVSSQEASPLLVARYLEKSLGDHFRSKLQEVLYEEVKPAGESPLINAIIRLCRPSRQREGIYAVVTYNFDDLIEEALSGIEIKCRAIYEEGTIPDPDELPIYHVHGRLTRPTNTDDAPTSSRLVFSEESYFELQSDHYSWANFEQLKLLRETTCLLIGLSGTDPNMRRLLDIDARQSKKVKHFICLKRQKASDLLGKDTSVRSGVAEHFLNVHHNLQEASFRDLGLNVIWVDRHEDIPSLLQELSISAAAEPIAT